MRHFFKYFLKAICVAILFVAFNIPERYNQILSGETTFEGFLTECKECIISSITNICEICGTEYPVSEEPNISVLNDEWMLVAENVEGTVYNAVPEQCDNDPIHTASMFRLNLDDVYSHKIIAMESTFMKTLGLKYGDVVKVEGTGQWDGVWQIQDTMNPRFAGQKKIDFLVPENITLGKWNTIKLYSLVDKSNTDIYKHNMAPQAKKSNS